MVMKDYDKYKGEKYTLFVVALTQGGLVYVVDEKDKELMRVARIKRIFVLSPDENNSFLKQQQTGEKWEATLSLKQNRMIWEK